MYIYIYVFYILVDTGRIIYPSPFKTLSLILPRVIINNNNTEVFVYLTSSCSGAAPWATVAGARARARALGKGLDSPASALQPSGGQNGSSHEGQPESGTVPSAHMH